MGENSLRLRAFDWLKRVVWWATIRHRDPTLVGDDKEVRTDHLRPSAHIQQVPRHVLYVYAPKQPAVTSCRRQVEIYALPRLVISVGVHST